MGGELPIACEVDIVGVGDEIEFLQNFFVSQFFPGGIAKTGKAHEGGLEGFEAFAIVESLHAEDAVGRLCLGSGRGF